MSCLIDAPKLDKNPMMKNGIPKNQKGPGACEAMVIQKTEKPMKSNPNGMLTRLGTMKGIFSGFPLHNTFYQLEGVSSD